MFWTNENHRELPESRAGRDLREQLRERLRLLAEFATLGAYELTDDAAAPWRRAARPRRRAHAAGASCSRGPRPTARTARRGREAVAQCPTPRRGASCVTGGRRRAGAWRGAVAASRLPSSPAPCRGRDGAGRPGRLAAGRRLQPGLGVERASSSRPVSSARPTVGGSMFS